MSCKENPDGTFTVEQATGMEHSKVTSPSILKGEMDTWMEERGIERGEVITDPAMRQEYFEYVINKIRNKKSTSSIFMCHIAETPYITKTNCRSYSSQ